MGGVKFSLSDSGARLASIERIMSLPYEKACNEVLAMYIRDRIEVLRLRGNLYWAVAERTASGTRVWSQGKKSFHWREPTEEEMAFIRSIIFPEVW